MLFAVKIETCDFLSQPEECSENRIGPFVDFARSLKLFWFSYIYMWPHTSTQISTAVVSMFFSKCCNNYYGALHVQRNNEIIFYSNKRDPN